MSISQRLFLSLMLFLESRWSRRGLFIVTAIVLSALMLTACGHSGNSANNLPPLPSSIENSGPPISWPKSDTLDDKESTALLGQCRVSELEKWRAVQSAKKYHNVLQQLYGEAK